MDRQNDRPCPICKGIGFKDGRLCSCITGTPDIPGELKAIFGDVFKKPDRNPDKVT